MSNLRRYVRPSLAVRAISTLPERTSSIIFSRATRDSHGKHVLKIVPRRERAS